LIEKWKITIIINASNTAMGKLVVRIAHLVV